MMTLNEARRLQKETESKVLLKFFGFSAIAVILGFLIVYCTGLVDRSPIFYFVPILFIFFIGKKTDIIQIFIPREFIGEVFNIDIYVVKSSRVKGELSYVRRESLEAEIMIRNKNGKKMTKVLPNGDITSRLCWGDEIAFLRFIDEPIIIKGSYLK